MNKPYDIRIVYSPDDFIAALHKPTNIIIVYDPDMIVSPTLNIDVASFDSSQVGSLNVAFTQTVSAVGFDALSVDGVENISNVRKVVVTTGFVGTSFGMSIIYNLKQFINLKESSQGIYSTTFGYSYLQGGVKYIDLNNCGIGAAQYGLVNVINTRAEQFANLANNGITPPVIPSPNVSPRFIRPTTLKSEVFGNPTAFLKTRLVLVVGVNNAKFGNGWISHSPRYLEPNYIDAFNSGFPKVFDPTQKIYVTGANAIITGGVFGDISARNTRRIIKASGFYSQSFSDWGAVESTCRAIEIKGFDSKSFGITNIYNKSPSIAPIGINSFAGLNSAIGYRIRTIKPSGWYQPKLGNHTLTKTPELKPGGFNQSAFGSTWVSNKTRSIYAGLGHESLAIGEINVWHFTRRLKSTGIFNDGYGTSRVEHGRRVLLANGSIHSVYGGSSWVSYAVRSLLPSSITHPNMPIHRVGGTQHIQPFGYVATLFGSRIIPESQSIYPQGFINPFGLTVIDLWEKYIKPNGFLTTGQEGGHRFGTHKFWNLRQYIEMYYDVDSGLTPPKWVGWTGIENKNKTIGAIGSNGARISEPNIENKARVLSPVGLNASTFSKSMIADRVRHLKLQGMEAPYISGWSAIYNAASVIAQKGFKADTFGVGTVLNTRRYFNRIGNFESLEMGKPMIADRIRTLKFEHRYTIAPPYIPIHSVHLYTRYIEEVGRSNDYQAFGNPSLSIHWNIITPRWTLRDAYGSPTLKNVTPELGTRGRNSEEFGQSSIRTQWRELLQQGSETVLWGRSEIAFRDRQFSVNGFTQWAIPRHTVIKTGVPPYYPQYIWLDSVEIDGEQNDSHGIKPPDPQVSKPSLKSNVIFPEGFIASRYGSHHTQSNGILVQPGLQELTVSEPMVSLSKRTIFPESIISSSVVDKPRLSPWTIYAVVEAPKQARDNHELRNLHYVYSMEVFGETTVENKHRKIFVDRNDIYGTRYMTSFGAVNIALKRHFIQPKGFLAQRHGVHVFGPYNLELKVFESPFTELFGNPAVKFPFDGNTKQYILPIGMDSKTINKPVIDFRNRLIRPVAFDSQALGYSRYPDTPYMWQSLRIGELIKGNYGGFEALLFGEQSISLKVRELKVTGFNSYDDSFSMGGFNQKLTVKLVPKPSVPVQLEAVGFVSSSYGVPNTKPAAHYIRPDGNADQFRKGAF